MENEWNTQQQKKKRKQGEFVVHTTYNTIIPADKYTHTHTQKC